MNIGYACLTIAVENTKIRNCTLKNATPERLVALAGENLNALERMIDYNAANGIRLFRISSDIVPFGASLAAGLPWDRLFGDRFAAIAEKIKRTGMRVSMHPGQYTVLNSPDFNVVKRAVDDLSYHARFLDALRLDATHKIVLHAGGKYGDAESALQRFTEVYRDLDPAIVRRLVLENDGSIYTIAEVLGLCARIGAPAVYDNLHNAIHPADARKNDGDWIALCRATWKPEDGAQKTHNSQPHPEKPRGAHSDTIAIAPFLEYVAGLSGEKPDIMLEVKDKNRSAVKCQLCLRPDRRLLEVEWGRYKYAVLERSPEAYAALRELLKDKDAGHAAPFYTAVERALSSPPNAGRAVNAMEHVWGYVSGVASPAEARRYAALRERCLRGEASPAPAKALLHRLARKSRRTVTGVTCNASARSSTRIVSLSSSFCNICCCRLWIVPLLLFIASSAY